ncbi:MAG: hypothetical protein QG599_239 [Pseudomonadota bacterium]|nr:hypothetical protein [Pseudomonadota bacterium]
MSTCHSEKKLLIPLVIAVLLPGCATSPDNATNDQQATVAQGAIFGAVLGGLLGAAVSDNKATGALIGAAAGGLIGAGIGSSIAERKAQYASEEDFLVAEIHRNQEFIREADAQNDQIYADIIRLDRESQRLAGEYRAGRLSGDALTGKKASMEKQLAQARQVNSLVEKQLADAAEVHRESQQKRGPEDQYTRQLEANLAQLKATREQASQNVVSLESIYDRMSI